MKKHDLIQDLMEVYLSGETSEETRKFVEEHLDECKDCREAYEQAKSAEKKLNLLKTLEIPVNGKKFIIQGGIDKRVLSKSREDIDREVLSKVPWLCLQGGFFPQVDHLVPPDVSLANYQYYSHLLREVVEDPERYLHEARKRGFWSE